MKRRTIYGIGLLLCLLLISCGRVEHSTSDSETDSEVSETEASETESTEPAESLPETKQVSFTVEPGALAAEIYQDLVEAGYGANMNTWLALDMTMDRTAFSWWSQIANPEERCFVTEGYIRPGTYQWSEDASAEEILAILLHGWDEWATEERLSAIESSGYTIDELLTMASIVEWEARYTTEEMDAEVRAQIARVIRNRLEQGMPLQMDTSWFYLEALEEIGVKDIASYEDSYDTYQIQALPPGPIANPGTASLEAVLNPAEGENLFFVYQIQTGEYYFAETYEEHLKNIEKAGL